MILFAFNRGGSTEHQGANRLRNGIRRFADHLIYPPKPLEKPEVIIPTEQSKIDRLKKIDLAKTKWENEFKAIDYVGVLCGAKPWDMTDRKVRSIICLSIGQEGRKMYARRVPHTDVEALSTIKLSEQLETTFIRTRNITYDRFLLFTRGQKKEQTVEQFHLALFEIA